MPTATSLTPIITSAVSTLTLVTHFLIVFLIVLMFKRKWKEQALSFLRKKAVLLGFLISFFAMAISLYYSEIALYEPCRLCWLQRIFLYPQVLLFATALIRKTKEVFAYSLPLTIIGLVIGIYHIIVQLLPQAESCSATAVSCSTSYFLRFGYISIPVMSLTAFVLLLILALSVRRKYLLNE